MNLLFSAIVAFFSVTFIFVGNLATGNGFISALLRSIIAGAIIFGLVTAVQFLLYRIFNVASFSTDKRSDDTPATEGASGVPNDVDIGNIKAGVNVDFVVGDEPKQNEMELETRNFTPDSSRFDSEDDNQEAHFDNINIDVQLADDSIIDGSDEESRLEEYIPSRSSPIVGRSKDEIIQDKLGMDASYEDMAKAIRTTLKRDE